MSSPSGCRILPYTAAVQPHRPTGFSCDVCCASIKVGQEVSEEEAQEAARKVAIQLIASIKSE